MGKTKEEIKRERIANLKRAREAKAKRAVEAVGTVSAVDVPVKVMDVPVKVEVIKEREHGADGQLTAVENMDKRLDAVMPILIEVITKILTRTGLSRFRSDMITGINKALEGKDQK